jgi:hypothetical protein
LILSAGFEAEAEATAESLIEPEIEFWVYYRHTGTFGKLGRNYWHGPPPRPLEGVEV